MEGKGVQNVLLLQVLFLIIQILAQGKMEEITFRYDKFMLNDTHATIAWNNPESCGNESVTYKLLKALRGSVVNANDSCDIQDTTYYINSSFLEVMFDDHYKFYVNACCNGYELFSQSSLEFPSKVRTERRSINPSNDVCLTPVSLAYVVIWPKSDNPANGSCSCSLWNMIDQCECIRNENFFGVYNKINVEGIPQICWKNITNHSRIHFVDETTNPFDFPNDIPFPLFNREFFLSYEFVLADVPNQPIVNEMKEGSSTKICYADIYEGNAEVTHFSVTITNNVNARISYNHSKTDSITCDNITNVNPYFFSASCYPVIVKVSSVNFLGASPQTINTLMDSSANSNECECFKQNVNVSLDIMNISGSQILLLEVLCSSQYINISEIMILVKFKSFSTVINRNVTCFNRFPTDSLESTNYIEMMWISQEGNECLLLNKSISFSTVIDSDNSDNTGLIVAVSVMAILIITIVIIISIIVTMRMRKRYITTKRQNELSDIIAEPPTTMRMRKRYITTKRRNELSDIIVKPLTISRHNNGNKGNRDCGTSVKDTDDNLEDKHFNKDSTGKEEHNTTQNKIENEKKERNQLLNKIRDPIRSKNLKKKNLQIAIK